MSNKTKRTKPLRYVLRADDDSDSAEIVLTGDDLFFVWRGRRIAKRGYAGTWVALEPGYELLDGCHPDGQRYTVVKYEAPPTH